MNCSIEIFKSLMAQFLLSGNFNWSDQFQMYSNIRCHILCIAELYRRKSDPGEQGSTPSVFGARAQNVVEPMLV